MGKVKIEDIVEVFEIQNDQLHGYCNKKTGEVREVFKEDLHDVDRGKETSSMSGAPLDKVKEILYSKDWVQLPTQHDIHEWQIMNNFCYEIDDESLKNELLNAIHGKGAFRMFKNIIYKKGLDDRWFKYREKVFREIAIDFCETHDIEYEVEEPEEEEIKEEDIICESDRLFIREVEPDDAYVIADWKGDPLVREMALDPETIISIEKEFQDIKDSLSSDSEEYYIIVLKGDKKPAGYIRINWMDRRHEMGFIRFVMGRERRKGYMSEALKIIIGKLFNEGVHRLEAEVYEFNKASLRVLEKLGFKEEGVKREAHFDGNDYHDVILFGLVKDS